MNRSSPSSPLLRLTGLWASSSKNGRRMLSGQETPSLKLLQATGNQPKWEAFVAPSEKREQQVPQPSRELF